ncbi:hypothetical protein WS61_16100 [Burkholderia sp. ABCPW 11]|uniref:hypothetical protein n=1 Tax=Burkholderia sp. ABCPW 11 TaxID=1637859 RepID=UPI00076CDD2D|nr:hypothetical protein [Burkholderia sp. ABCPW 11]KVD43775.1 hypothetical protein WS61_16100 [Burkholderia sp. ABCPW 11]
MATHLGQPGRPRGLAGRIAGRIMRQHNRLDNVWTLSLLAIGDSDRVLEVGFGPATRSGSRPKRRRPATSPASITR